jgi:predicted GNAT family acetyltransferase
MNYVVMNNTDRHRFEVTLEGRLGVLNYREDGKSITFIHTEVPPDLAGHGIASALARAGLEYARERKLQVIPECEFVAGYVRKHSEFAHLLSSS